MSGPKTARLNIRLNGAERDDIVHRAQHSGMSLSEYIRRCCLRHDERPVIVADTETLKALYTNLRRAGGNLNQCARSLNYGRRASITDEELAAAFAAVSQASSDISQFISDVRESV